MEIVYVDDLIILVSLMSSMKVLKAKFEEYKMSDLSKLHFYLWIEVVEYKATCKITMSQYKFIRDVLKQFGMEDCKLVATPLDVKHNW